MIKLVTSVKPILYIGFWSLESGRISNNKAIIVSNHTSSSWTLTTVVDTIFGTHKVYVRGVDGLTDFIVNTLQYISGNSLHTINNLWYSFQDKVNDFVNNNGGGSNSSVNDKQNLRPDWSLVRKVLNGEVYL
ncbi:hypothetical protein ACFRAE_17155 [Sphingobacterium sp. HJSM2_6]|uniref:hypothetical protein n=1 Tax=Sphingobacterium sp. HJSM2_6 TaxID=3366264 RepID=UPI003BE81AED